MWFDSSRPNARGVLLFAVGLALATSFTFWLGLRATREWQRSTLDASETRANEVAALLTVALERDMKGGQISVLVPFNEALVNSPPYELADRFARGFARFPYLESFYVWTERGGPRVSPPARKGFGHLVIDDMVARAIDGKVEMQFAEQGLTWTASVPEAALVRDARGDG